MKRDYRKYIGKKFIQVTNKSVYIFNRVEKNNCTKVVHAFFMPYVTTYDEYDILFIENSNDYDFFTIITELGFKPAANYDKAMEIE